MRRVAGVTWTVVLAVVAVLGTAHAADKGGASCTLNVQCGWPAANVDSLREQAASLTGSCVNGACQCASFYGCPDCGVIELSAEGTTRSVSGGGTIELCDLPWGGGVCNADSQCTQGVCIDNKCICYKDWACKYCTLDLSQDILNGAMCGDYVAGHGACSVDSDCNSPYGVCRNGACQCGSGFACAHCDRSISALIAKTTTCPCTKVDCSGHGSCHNGVCICADGFEGATCSFDPCADVSCSGHGSCSRSTGKCTCDEGYAGDDCAQGGGFCEEDKHCGIFGTKKYGGQCTDEGECECWEGYTCQDCSGIGDNCAEATGGGPCSSVYDCGVFESGFGGQCVFTDEDKYWVTTGRCRCWPGLTCQQCNVRVSDRDAGASCPPPVDSPASRARLHAIAVLVCVAAVALLVL